MRQRRTAERRVKGRAVGGNLEELGRDVASLPALDMPALRQRWAALMGDDPSPNWGRALLVRALAYRLQERSAAGLKPATQRLLDRVAENGTQAVARDLRNPRASAGSVLIREWGGVRHRVTVLDHDVLYQGRHYKSLSEVARAITGARWSGPRFFGLNGRAKETLND